MKATLTLRSLTPAVAGYHLDKQESDAGHPLQTSLNGTRDFCLARIGISLPAQLCRIHLPQHLFAQEFQCSAAIHLLREYAVEIGELYGFMSGVGDKLTMRRLITSERTGPWCSVDRPDCIGRTSKKFDKL